MFKGIITALGALFDRIGHAFTGAVKSVEPKAVAEFDALVAHYTPIAVDQVKAVATDPSLLSDAERRSQAFTKLAMQLQTDGHDITKAGFSAFVNLLIEVGVNFIKLLEGKSLVPAPAGTKEAQASAEALKK